MDRVITIKSTILELLNINPFKEHLPWIGGDLQTLKDTFVFKRIKFKETKKLLIPIPRMKDTKIVENFLVGFLNYPSGKIKIKGAVILLHGLGGSSNRHGLKRITKKLLDSGFITVRINLRGAGPGRYVSAGTYSANCSSDLIPAIEYCKEKILLDYPFSRKEVIPFFGVGLSLGGTILINTCLDSSAENKFLDGLVCVSSPLDLSECSRSIERLRNKIYQKWLLKRLKDQTIEDILNFNLINHETYVKKINELSSIREFDELITAPRWNYSSVEEYYKFSSPLNRKNEFKFNNTKILIILSEDDPWVPYKHDIKDIISTYDLLKNITLVTSKKGGHNGFHDSTGCWSDKLIESWLIYIGNNLSK